VIALAGGLTGITIHLAGRRDLGGSVLADRVAATPRLALLSGPTAFAVRLARVTLLAWAVAIAALALLMGYIARQAGRMLAGSATIRHALGRFGEHGGGAAAYLGFTFLMVAVLLSFLAAAQVTSARAE
jgi:ABC-2 type transport system permease protein